MKFFSEWLHKRRRIKRLRRAGRKLVNKGSNRGLPRYLKKGGK